jgi:hypothetical protein
MLKKPTSFVLAALRDSTYGTEYALSSPRLLWPRWTAFLTILLAILAASQTDRLCDPEGIKTGFSAACFRPLVYAPDARQVNRPGGGRGDPSSIRLFRLGGPPHKETHARITEGCLR